MKPALLILALAACLTFAGDAPQPGLGRFAVIPATLETNWGGDTLTEQTIIKLDTQTGECWRYVSVMQPNGELQQGWLAIPQIAETVARLPVPASNTTTKPNKPRK